MANNFVYPDALNLDSLASDADGPLPTTGIIWSYTADGSAVSRYSINNRAPMITTGAVDDPTNPPAAKSIGAGATDDPASVDANIRTITFRDTTLSPVAGPNVDPFPNTTATQIANSGTLTLFASDGTAFSQKSFIVYSEREGSVGAGVDRLSAATISTSGDVLQQTPSSAGTLAWTSGVFIGAPTMASANGLCFQVATGLANEAFATWTSPYGLVNLTQNAVYRIRITMDDNTTTALTAGLTPFWDLVAANFSADGSQGSNKYAVDFLNLDNFPASGLTGGTNPNSAGVPSTSPRTFDVWFCPPPINNADWNDASTGEFTATQDANNDMAITFRLLDVDNSANNAAVDAGTLCLRTIKVDRVPISSLRVSSTAYDNTQMHNDATSNATQVSVSTLFPNGAATGSRTLITTSGGQITASPNVNGASGIHAWDLEVVGLQPGDAANTVPTINYPIPWVSGQLLMGTIGVQAPDSASAANPVDAVAINWDTLGQELFQITDVLASTDTIGLPKTTPGTYVSFFYTHTKTNATAANADRIRMTAQAILRPDIRAGNVDTNTGGITFTRMRVDVISGSDVPS